MEKLAWYQQNIGVLQNEADSTPYMEGLMKAKSNFASEMQNILNSFLVFHFSLLASHLRIIILPPLEWMYVFCKFYYCYLGIERRSLRKPFTGVLHNRSTSLV